YTFKNNGNEDIYLINPDGSHRTQLTNHSASDADPDWSPDSTQLVFASSRDGNTHIYKINADGTNAQPLTAGDSTNAMPVWAPNGDKIAFVSNRDGDWEIFVMDVDGGNLTQLTDNDTVDQSPTWSLNSKQIAFVSERDGSQQIYVMDVDGSNQTRLTHDPDFESYDPAWSPDGHKIAFTTHYDGHEGISVMNHDGSDAFEVTLFAADSWLPAWSADGAEIIFSSNQNGDDNLYVISPDGSSLRQLTADIGADFAPAWGVQDVYVQRVFHIIYDPYLPTRGRLLSSYFVDPRQQVYDVVRSLQSHTDQRVQYVLQDQVVVDAFPPRSDGFLHDETSYMGCMASNWPNTTTCAGFVWADYDSIINDPTLDICGRLNRDEIDEVWLDMMPRTGFYESVLAGPAGFAYNGPTFTANTCDALIPIMAMNYEWTWDGGHIFGHRAEATMTRVYGGWAENAPEPHHWEQFGMVRWQSPDFAYAGCGSIHYAPNAMSSSDEYGYGLIAPPFGSVCDDFVNYPDLGVPEVVKTAVSCTTWNCNANDYYHWWFHHLPHQSGFGSDGRHNDWWLYFLDPNLAYAAPLADFTVTLQNDEPPFEVSLTNLSLGSYDTVTWDFGNGSGSSQLSPVATYAGEGVYEITLTLSGPFGSDTLTQNVATLLPPTEPGLVGRYYDFTDTPYTPPTDPFGDGTLRFEQVDSNIDYHWGSGSPNASLLGNDQYAIQWEGWVRSPYSGIVTFHVHSDDGTRLTVGSKSNESWVICGNCHNYLTLDMAAGQWYPILVEYFEDGGDAQIQLEWLLPNQTTYTAIGTGHLFARQTTQPGLLGTYYDYEAGHFVVPDDPFGDGTEKFAQYDGNVDFYWGDGSPDAALLGNDDFAVRWEGWVRSPVTGDVIFQAHSDDGTRLDVGDDHSEVWIICGNCVNMLTVPMEADRWYPIQLDFFEDGGTAQVQLHWQLPGSSSFVPVPQGHLVAPTDHCRLLNAPALAAQVSGDELSLTIGSAYSGDTFYLYRLTDPYATPNQYDLRLTSHRYWEAVADGQFYFVTEANGLVCETAQSNRLGVIQFEIVAGE
ncbi:MAG: PD40 domain-containing protein, partial [Anaerolineales bacterium]|nr:PD40 domain-containing protein [Anaerolineales bacterium]